uniref:VWFA domain-containing protein n=1 Tax=Panagrolaimus superbus TaxID=310955 RepID=A0A914Z1H8_9BILA
MRFIPNPHPPIIINTLIQVYVDGKNKTVGNPALEGRVVTGIQNNDRVILTKEFDVKTHKFIEENGKANINQKNLIQVNAVADTNSTKIARDDLQKELEKELEHSIPLILDELDKIKINNKINMAKDNMMTDNLNTQKGKNKQGNEEEVSIEDLEKLIREGLNELEDSEAKKQLEKEFKEVVEATTTTSAEKFSTSYEPPPTSTKKVHLTTTQKPITVTTTEGHEIIILSTPNGHESNMVIREMQPQIDENEDSEVEVSTLPPGVVTFVANIEPATQVETEPESTLTTVETIKITTPKAVVLMPESAEMMAPIKSMIIKSQESIEREEEDERWRSTPEPPEMMAPEKAMIMESEEDIEIEKQTPVPAEMIMPVKAMIIKSAEEMEASTHAPVTAEMVVPSLAMIIKSVEETEEDDVTFPTSRTTTTVAPTTTTVTSTTTSATTTTTTTKKTTPTTTTTSSTTTTSTIPATTTTLLPTTESTPELITTTQIITEPPTESTTEFLTTEITTELTTESPTTESITEIITTTEIETTIPEITETSTLATTTEETTIITSTTSTTPTTTSTTTATPSTTTTITLPFASEQCEIPNDESEKLKGDILFLLDSSTSIGNATFQKAVQLVKQIVLNFSNIGPKGVQFALIQYNREPWLEFTFRRHTCLSLLLDDIEDTEFMNGPSNLGRALNKVMKYAFTPARGDRPDVENVVVLVSDGLSEDNVQLPLTLSRQNGTTPIVVATLQAKKDILMDIAEKDQNNMFNLTEALHKPLGERLAQRIKEILKSNESFENFEKEPTTSSVSSTTPGKDISETDKTMGMMQQNEVEPSSIDMELTAAPIVPMVPAEDDSVQVVCAHDGVKAQFQVEEYYGGILVARDFSNSSDCSVAIPVIAKNSSNLRQISINLKYSQCGISVVQSDFPKGVNYSLVLNLLHNKEIVTARDRSFIIQCFRPTSVINSTLEAQLDVIGCSADSTLLNEIIYSNDKLLAFAKSYVFTLVDVSTLLFTCKVSLCVRDGDGCEGYSPPVCPSFNSTANDVLLTRRVRNYDGALQTALTSELSTTIVDVSDPLSAIRIHQLHLPIALVIIIALLLGSIMGVIWHFCQNKSPKKIFSRSGTSHGSTFPDDESTTDKSETLSFRSLDFRTPEERSMDLSEVATTSPSSPEIRRPSTT